MTPEDVTAHLESRLPDFNLVQEPTPLSGGLMNFVWRVVGQSQSVIVKYAPPYIAALPDVSLDPQRILFEARCLQAFGPGGQLEGKAPRISRPPLLLDFDAQTHIIIQEDVGPYPGLGHWLQDEANDIQAGARIGKLIGQFVGVLHGETVADKTLQKSMNNLTIQQERFKGQYAVIADYLRKGDVQEASTLGMYARDLGQRLLQPGRCLIMGDLWPPSILVTDDGLRIIDWEFAHFGQPAQDVAHLVAHLWMHIHRAPTAQLAQLSQAVLDNFLQSYQVMVGDKLTELFDDRGVRDCKIHFGAEVLARTIGVYQPGSLYDGLPASSIAVREAIRIAVAHIRESDSVQTFAMLEAS